MLTLLILSTLVDFSTIKADTWTPGPTKFTVMSIEERAEYLLHTEPQPPNVQINAILSGEPEPVPLAFDWMPYQTSVKDQGPCGSCWAFASLAAVEAGYRIATDDPTLDIDLSEQFAVSCLPGGCDGGLIETVMGQLRLNGVPDENCFPYSGRDFAPCAARCEDWKWRSVNVQDWAWVIPMDGDDMKRALRRGPVVTAMVVYSDLWAYTGGVYEHVTGDAEGYHAVLLVGHDGDVWIAKNSWGVDFGELGYLRIREGQAGIASYGVQVYINEADVPDVTRPPVVGCGCGMVW
jgi:hypothetical protein